MDTQNQNQPQNPQASQPNFDFIMNQPGPDPAKMGGRKKFSKKMVILGVLSIFTVIMLAVLVFVPAPTTKKLADNNQNTGSETPINGELPVTITDNFLQNVRDAKTYSDNKPAMTTQLQAVMKDENVYNFALGRITDAIDITTCQKVSSTDTVSEYNCQKKADGQAAKLIVSTANDTDGTMRVNGIKVGT